MATAAAVVAVSVPMLDDEQRNRCVACNASRPRDGKFLHCLHVICLGCLNDSIREPGCVKCALCGETTNSLRHIHLSQQLTDSRPVLYPDVEANAASAPATSGVEEKILCSLCADCDVVKEVTHKCVSCDIEPMCQRHAERHSAGRIFLGHRVIELSANGAGGQVTTIKTSHSCPLHTNHELEKYCVTCQYSVCERCLATGHHQQHNVQAVAETAASLRSQLHEHVSQAGSSGRGDDKVQPVAAKINALRAEITEVKQSATVSSEKVAALFKEVRALTDTLESQFLADVEERCWKLVEPLEMQCERLQVLRLKETTGVDVVNYLSSEKSSDAEVVELSHLVTGNLERLPYDIEKQSVGNVHTGSRIVVEVESNAIGMLQRVMASLAQVRDNFIALPESKVHIPTRVLVDNTSVVTLIPCDCEGRPIAFHHAWPSLACTVVSPCGGRSSARVECHGDDTVGRTMDIIIQPKEIGRHCLELRYGGKTRSVEFESIVGVQLDPAKCSSRIHLSNNNRRAVLAAGATRASNVLAREGYTQGTHQWSVKATRCSLGLYHIGIGVCRAPSDGNYNAACEFFRPTRYYWLPYGCSVRKQRTSEWQDGDIVTLKLNCDAKTLALHLHRTGERKVITDIDCSQPLYPTIHLHKPGHEAELI